MAARASAAPRLSSESLSVVSPATLATHVLPWPVQTTQLGGAHCTSFSSTTSQSPTMQEDAAKKLLHVAVLAYSLFNDVLHGHG